METENTSTLPLRITYLLVNLMLFLPVIMWPLSVWLSSNVSLASQVFPVWLISLGILLMVMVCFDTILYGASNKTEAINAALWIAIYGLFTAFALSQSAPVELLAGLFFIHSLRSAFRLFRQQKVTGDTWWWWVAYARDLAATLIILFWITALS